MIDTDAFERLIERLRGRIDDDVLDGLESYYRHGEYGLGIEHLCDELYERDQVLPEEVVQLVSDLGDSMSLQRRSFKLLTHRQ